MYPLILSNFLYEKYGIINNDISIDYLILFLSNLQYKIYASIVNDVINDLSIDPFSFSNMEYDLEFLFYLSIIYIYIFTLLLFITYLINKDRCTIPLKWKEY
jgi:hypothetical protein